MGWGGAAPPFFSSLAWRVLLLLFRALIELPSWGQAATSKPPWCSALRGSWPSQVHPLKPGRGRAEWEGPGVGDRSWSEPAPGDGRWRADLIGSGQCNPISAIVIQAAGARAGGPGPLRQRAATPETQRHDKGREGSSGGK